MDATLGSRALVPGFAVMERPTPDSPWNLVGLSLDVNSPDFVTPDWTPPPEHEYYDMSWATELANARSASYGSDIMDGTRFVDVDLDISCPEWPLYPSLVSEEPLVVYIPSFLSQEEIDHVIRTSETGFQPSSIFTTQGVQREERYRKSENAFAVRDDVLRCIERRAKEVQDWQSNYKLEAITIQRYDTDGFFDYHYDHVDRFPARPDRLTTFNVYLEGNCQGGGTHFPYLTRPTDEAWCKYIECKSTENGIVFKPVAGSAVYWANIRSNGTGYNETLHQGMRVESGTKVGMNIWTWIFPEEGQVEHPVPEP